MKNINKYSNIEKEKKKKYFFSEISSELYEIIRFYDLNKKYIKNYPDLPQNFVIIGEDYLSNLFCMSENNSVYYCNFNVDNNNFELILISNNFEKFIDNLFNEQKCEFEILCEKKDEKSIIDKLNIGKININDKNKEGESFFYIAFINDLVKVVNKFIDKGFEVNNKGYMLLASANKNSKMLTSLLKYNLNIEEKNISGCTPIFTATICGNLENIELLINKGANINIVLNNETPLDIVEKRAKFLSNKKEKDNFLKIRDIMLKNGAKKYLEL